MRSALWITGAATILTAALAAPVLVSPSTRIAGAEIVGRHHDPFTVILQFARPPALSTYTQPVTDFAGTALARITGAVAAYNLIVLVSFPLSALCAYLFALKLTRNAAAAAVAAFAFAFSPFHVAHAAYHPHIAQVQWIPLYLLALWMCLERFTPWRGAGLASAIATVVLSNFYGGFIAAVVTPFVVIGFFLSLPPEERRTAVHGAWPTIAVLAAAVLAGAAYVRAVAPDVITATVSLSAPREDLERYGAAWWAYFAPAAVHPMTAQWGSAVMARAGVTTGLLEQQVMPGWTLIALAVVAVTAALAGDRKRRHVVGPLVLIACVAFLCSLAPDQMVGGLVLPAPAMLLHRIAPMFRSYARFAVVVNLATAILGGIGFAHLTASPRRWSRAAGWILVALLCVELPALALRDWRSVLPTQAHRWLATLPASARIVVLTRATPAEESIASLVGRDVSFLPADAIDIREPDLSQALAARGFTYALYYRPSTVARWLESHPPDGLRVVRSFADSAVLAVDPERPRLTLEWAGFYPREDSEAGSWRWTGDGGTWRVANREREPVRVTLQLEAESFGADREVDVLVNGTRLETLTIGQRRRWFETRSLILPAGDTRVLFRPKAPPVPADTLLHNGDPRALSIAVWKWKWRWITEPPG